MMLVNRSIYGIIVVAAATLLGMNASGNTWREDQSKDAVLTEGFTVVLLPDTQCYISLGEGSHSCGPAPRGSVDMLQAQMKWIVASRARLSIAAVLGLGDITECGSYDGEWRRADTSYGVL